MMSTQTAEHGSIAAPVDALAAELAAMQVIARALSDIDDRESRHRVLCWAKERFITALPPVAPPVATAVRSALADDPTLSVEGLEEFFEQPRGVAEMLALQTMSEFVPIASDDDFTRSRDGGWMATIGILARGLANGLRALAADWQTV
ncbi:MAG TPA: hypothetical protein VKD69_04390 [Vicinamibacterales bacterium]|nr:hypothetical protein [Vicinamibacterales bacterium]